MKTWEGIAITIVIVLVSLYIYDKLIKGKI